MTVDLANIAFNPMYMVGLFLGALVAWLIRILSGGIVLSDTIVNSIGLLSMSTILLGLAGKTKKIAWGIVKISWALIIMRIGMLTYTGQ